MSSGRAVGLALVTLLAFVRIASDARVFVRPLTPVEACGIVESWLAAPSLSLVAPGPRTWQHLADICRESQATGALVMDAHLAALAREHGTVIATADRDFRRFSGIKTVNPLADEESV